MLAMQRFARVAFSPMQVRAGLAYRCVGDARLNDWLRHSNWRGRRVYRRARAARLNVWLRHIGRECVSSVQAGWCYACLYPALERCRWEAVRGRLTRGSGTAGMALPDLPRRGTLRCIFMSFTLKPSPRKPP